MKMKNIFIVNTALVLLSLTACSALKPNSTPTPTPVPTQPQPTPTAVIQQTPTAARLQYYFVTNKLLIPTTREQTQAFALNLDANPQDHTENLFGQLLTLLTSAVPGLELQLNVDQMINSGQMVTLHLVNASDPLNDPNVSWSIFQGQRSQSAPRFDGSDKFTLDPAAPINPPIIGTLTNGHYSGGPGKAQVQMVLLGQPVSVDLIGVHLETDLSPKGCANGILGGGITIDEFRTKLLPALTDGLNQMIKTDKSVAPSLLQTFDSDNNGTITIQELESNPVLMLAITPDLDLLDSSGKFDPGVDGVKDSFSLGLGFTCVPAAFPAPGN
jgi:hypothetical protein